jgi:hypothetical protein
MSDEAVKAKTGKTWVQWFAILDKAGAVDLNHQAIVAFLHKKYEVGPWWEQMVTVTYELGRGHRKPHQKPEGYEIAVSKTLSVPISVLYDAWIDAQKRSLWLKDSSFAIRKATRNKSLRFTWVDGKTQVVIGFYAKGPHKGQVAAQHSKLANAKAAASMKTFWARQLANLQEFLKG